MITYNSAKIGAALRRGFLTTGILAAALSVSAQQDNSQSLRADRLAHETASAPQQHKAGDETTCINEAAKMNMATIQFAQLAQQKAQNPELKRFSQTLENDHKKAQAKLEKIASKHNVTLPTGLDSKCEEELTKLRGYSGAEFDKEFAKGAIEGHAMALAKLEQPDSQNEASDISAYKRDMLTHVREHQQRAREVAKAVGVDQATIAALENKAKEGVGTPGSSTESGSSTSDNSREYKNKSDSDQSSKSPSLDKQETRPNQDK